MTPLVVIGWAMAGTFVLCCLALALVLLKLMLVLWGGPQS